MRAPQAPAPAGIRRGSWPASGGRIAIIAGLLAACLVAGFRPVWAQGQPERRAATTAGPHAQARLGQPWLARLPQARALIRRYARLVLLDRQVATQRRRLARLPHPADTIVSEDRARRQRRRQVVARSVARRVQEQRALEQPVRVPGAALLPGGFTELRTRHQVMSPAAERAGRRAVAAELQRRVVTVHLLRDPYLAGQPRLVVVRVDGARVPVAPAGVHLDELLDAAGHPVHTELRRAFYRAVAWQQAREMDARPAEVQAALDFLIERGLHLELAAEEPAWRPGVLRDADAGALAAVRRHRQQVARELGQATHAALAPLALGAGMLVPGGPVELMLEVLPPARIGARAAALARAGVRAARARKSRRQLQQLAQELGEALDGPAGQFVKQAANLGPGELQALHRIYRQTRSDEVIVKLLGQHERGDADLVWLAGLLQRKQARGVDEEFVRRFTLDADLVADYTLYDAYPSWRVLQAIAQGGQVTARQRASLASKVRGLMTERAAAQMLRRPELPRRLLGGTGEHLLLRRGLRWSRDTNLDLVALSSIRSKVIVGEVKGWSAQMWRNPKERKRVLQQLRRHDREIPEVLRSLRRSPDDLQAKVLFVDKHGYEAGLEDEDLIAFEASIAALGWRVELIPSEQVIGFGQLIEHCR